jgi:hypothetical protein
VTAPPVQPAQAAPSSHPPRWPYALVPALHLLAALSGPIAYLYATSVPVIGANIGAGLALMWTAAWGLPWSVVPWNATGTTNQEAFVAFSACALLNVGLVAALFFLLYRRPAARMTSQAKMPLRRWHYMLVPALALLSVLVGPSYFWLSYYGSVPGESFGAPIFGDYWNSLVGLPWSIWVWGDPGALSVYGPTICALINVGLISLGFWLAYRRARRRSSLNQPEAARQ